MSHALLNDVVVESTTNDLFRLVEVNDQYVILFALPDDPCSPSRELRFRQVSTAMMRHLLETRRMRRVENHGYWPQFKGMEAVEESRDESEAEVLKGALKIKAHRFQVVKKLLAGGFKPLLGHGKAKYFKPVAEEFGVSVEAARKWVVTFLTLGMTESALFPAYDRRGGKDKQREPGEAKRGRPAIYEGADGINAPPELVTDVETFIKLNLQGMKSVDDLYDRYCEKRYVDGVRLGPSGERLTIILPNYMRCSKWTFRKIFTRLGYQEKMIGRFGQTEWNKHLRDILGNEAARAFLPGAVYQLDFSRANIIVLHDTYRHAIGRPLFGLVTDVGSPMIAGLRLSMANPSEQEALLLCEQAFLSKVAYMRSIGIEIDVEEWPVEGLPNKVCADNGELRGKRSNILAKDLGIIFELMRAWTPTDKGTVESKYSRYKTHELPWLPGYAQRYRERGDAKCELDDCLSISAFRQVMAYITLDLIQEPIDDRFMPPGALAEGRIPSGLDLWNWSMEGGLGGLRPCPGADILRFMFLPRGNARVSGKGFAFKGLHYTCKALSAEGYFASRRRRSQWVAVVFEPNLVDCIYVTDQKGKVHVCPLAEKEMFMYGHQRLSFDDVDALVGRRRGGIYKAADKLLQRRSDRMAVINEIIAAEKDLTRHILRKTTYSLGSVSAQSMKMAQSLAAAEEKKINAKVVDPQGNGASTPHLTLMGSPAVADGAEAGDASETTQAMKDDLAMLRKKGKKSA